MENRLNKVHISYKHDKEHEAALKAIVAGLKKNDIAFSIDQYDILYRGSIDQYEIEIFDSGAYKRDAIRWPHGHYIEDQDEKLNLFKDYVKERLKIMDTYVEEITR